MSYFKSKLFSVVPSIFTISDVVGLMSPPMSMVPSSTLQDTWVSLFSWRVWLVRAQVPVAGLNCSQLDQAWLASPPQMRKVSRVWADLATTILGSRHELEVDGRNTSADGSSPNPLPPVMRMAANG